MSASGVKRQSAGKLSINSFGCDHLPGMRRAMVTGEGSGMVKALRGPGPPTMMKLLLGWILHAARRGRKRNRDGPTGTFRRAGRRERETAHPAASLVALEQAAQLADPFDGHAGRLAIE